MNDIAARHSELQSLKAEIESKGVYLIYWDIWCSFNIGRSSVAIIGDVSIEEDVNQLVEATVEALGHLAVNSNDPPFGQRFTNLECRSWSQMRV